MVVGLTIAGAIFLFYLVHTTPHYFDLIVAPSTWDIPVSKEISKSDALHDWAILERIFRTGFAGYDYLRTQGKDWDALFAEGRGAITDKADVFPTCEFMQIIQRFLDQIEDRHLSLLYDSMDCPFNPPRRIKAFATDLWLRLGDDLQVEDDLTSLAVSPNAQLLDCPGFDLDKDLHFAAVKKDDKWHFGQRLIFLSKEKSPDAISCRFRRSDGIDEIVKVALHRLTDSKLSGKINKASRSEFSIKPGKTTHVRLGSFSRMSNKLQMDLPNFAPTVNLSSSLLRLKR